MKLFKTNVGTEFGTYEHDEHVEGNGLKRFWGFFLQADGMSGTFHGRDYETENRAVRDGTTYAGGTFAVPLWLVVLLVTIFVIAVCLVL